MSCPQCMACSSTGCRKRLTTFCHGPVGDSTHSILKMKDRAARHVGHACTAQLGGESDDALQWKLRIDRLLRWVWTWFELKTAFRYKYEFHCTCDTCMHAYVLNLQVCRFRCRSMPQPPTTGVPIGSWKERVHRLQLACPRLLPCLQQCSAAASAHILKAASQIQQTCSTSMP